MPDPLKKAIEDYIAAHGGDGAYPTNRRADADAQHDAGLAQSDDLPAGALCHCPGRQADLFGERVFDYAAMQCLVISLTLPAFGRVMQARPESRCWRSIWISISAYCTM